jgi:alkylation response protein AidB-like acyl-CoA dehydrogenase
VRFLLSEDQEALRDGIRSLCQGRFPMERVRAGFDVDGWKELAAAGVFTLADLGGLADAAVVFEELGRALVPGPLVWGYLAGRDEVVGGFEQATGVVEQLDHLAAVYLIGADTVDRVDVTEAVPVERPLDPLTELSRVVHASVEERVGDAAAWRTKGAVLVAAQLVGIAAACTDQAVAYAKERQQFDKPIGSFQAVKHICADMLVRTEVARAAVHAAAVTVDYGVGGAGALADTAMSDERRAVSGAKVLAGENALANAKASIQVHGGMGFTWEIDAHLYLKRAWLLDRWFGSAAEHAAALGGRR